MNQKNPQQIIWLWLVGIFVVIGMIGVSARCRTAAVAGPAAGARGPTATAPGGVAPGVPVQIQAGVPTGMNTGALENTYNQIGDVLTRITVSIYGTSAGQTSPQLLGSGVVVGRQLILTNAHVIQNATDLSAAVNGSAQADYALGLFRCDLGNDFALLQVTNNLDFPDVGILGNSDRVDRGDIVFATGNAFGTGNLLASGMIIDNNFSYTFNGQTYNNKLRTNINIYPGSCGGALVNINGEVVGVNNSAGLEENNYMGIGYATPINRAVALLNSASPNSAGPSNGFMPVAYSGNPYVLT